MAGNGSRGGSGRSTGGVTLDRRRESNVLAAINGSGGKGPYAINTIKLTNRNERDLRMLSQVKGLDRLLKTGLRNRANLKRTNRQISRANDYIGTEGRYTTPRLFKAAVGRSKRQLENSARTVQRAQDYLSGQWAQRGAPRNNIRPSLATRKGRQARVERFKRQLAAFGMKAAMGGIARRGLDAQNAIRRIRRKPSQ
jgi:hypothetical protein